MHYFETHHIRVLTKQPLHNIFRNRDNTRRIGKWATELSEYVIDFERRSNNEVADPGRFHCRMDKA
jgi:hypothetical protein